MRVSGALVWACAAFLSAQSAQAAECTNPKAFGTSRSLVVDPASHALLGTQQYRYTLPLEDHEVVLTFDDGPLPRYTNAILDILASECVSATFFMVGQMAQEFPSTVRRVAAEGHTIGTHSQNHPLTFERMSLERARAEIDEGFASVAAALGETGDVAPFFRIPGLARQSAVERYLAERKITTFSTDVTGDDWRHVRAADVVNRTMRRLDARGRGIILLHDIHAVTVIALPVLLRTLREHGYRVVSISPTQVQRRPSDGVPLPPDRKNPAEPPVVWATTQSIGAGPESGR